MIDYDVDNVYAFISKLDNTRQFLHLLKALSFQDRVNVFISPNGLKVTVDEAKSMQMSAFVESTFFYEFLLRDGKGDVEGKADVAFNVCLTTLLNCIELGQNDSTQLKICYQGYGNPLRLFIADQGLTFDSVLNTREVEDCLNFNFTNSTVLAKIICSSEMFKDVVSSLNNAADYVTLQINETSIKFISSTIYGDSEVEVKCSSRMIESYKCVSAIKATFKLSLLKQGFKPLAFSEKLSLRVDSRDFLCIQHMMKVEGEGRGFAEFYCVPHNDLEEE